MAKLEQVRVPDIGDFKDVDIIEVLVAPGATVKPEDSLITLESEKATMEVPSPVAGTVKDIAVKVGDKVSEGSLICTVEVEERPSAAPPAEAPEERAPPAVPAPPAPAPPVREAAPPAGVERGELHAEVLVLGAGPGGYTAAFRAADLGKQVVLVERYPTLGGVCLNVGCIPSKALLHIAEVVNGAVEAGSAGIRFAKPEIDAQQLREWWKKSVVGVLTGGLARLAKQRKVQVVQASGRFSGPHQLVAEGAQGRMTISFDQAIIAAGSRAMQLPGAPHPHPRLLDSTSALELPAVGKELLVVGGGIIGLEMATFYEALGTRVTVVERSADLLPGVDRDLVKPLQRRIQGRYANIFLDTSVTGLEIQNDGVQVGLQGPKAPESARFDYVLVAIGRRANGDRIGAEQAGVHVAANGCIPVDRQQRTNVPHIFAIGDIVGQPQLAHKASYEGRVAAEVIAGLKSENDARAIPSVAYTDPEIAWAGLTETEARAQQRNFGKGVFPWAASGRALSMGRNEGTTKILFDQDTHRVLGLGMVGPRAGELIAEGTLAIEMGADAEDLGLTIHPHPTLSETLSFAAEAFSGTITDLYVPKR